MEICHNVINETAFISNFVRVVGGIPCKSQFLLLGCPDIVDLLDISRFRCCVMSIFVFTNHTFVYFISFLSFMCPSAFQSSFLPPVELLKINISPPCGRKGISEIVSL